MCGFCEGKMTPVQKQEIVGRVHALDNNPPDKPNLRNTTWSGRQLNKSVLPDELVDAATLVGRATGKEVGGGGVITNYPPQPALAMTEHGVVRLSERLEDFGKEERGPRPAALEELRQVAEILENMDGNGGLGDETKFLRLMSEVLFMFDQDARTRMLRWLNSACA